MSKDVLAIDLGTNTGFCYNRAAEIFQGTWTLATTKEVAQWGRDRLRRRKDPRVERLCEHLDALGGFSLVVFEDVLFGSTTYATQLWSGLRSSVWLCAQGGIFECVPVGTLKAFATGNGHATKEQMSAALRRKHPEHWTPALNDDAIDATFLYLFAKQNFC